VLALFRKEVIVKEEEHKEEENSEEHEEEEEKQSIEEKEEPSWEYEFRTIGKSNYGLLGQGKQVKDSRKFSKVVFPVEKITSIEEVCIGNAHFLVRLNKSSAVYGWGAYSSQNENSMVHEPKELPFFSPELKVHKLSSGKGHTMAYVQKEGADSYFVMGQFAPFAKNDEVRSLRDLAKVDIEAFYVKGSTAFISSAGVHVPGQPVVKKHKHEQKENTEMLHFFKEGENFVYLTAREALDRPEPMFAIK